jgi:hypothetical protein
MRKVNDKDTFVNENQNLVSSIPQPCETREQENSAFAPKPGYFVAFSFTIFAILSR